MATTHATEKAQQTCPRCTEPATKQCGGCKSIAYCSLECQQADWPVHKNLCKSFKDFSGPRPQPDMRRVVVFHPNEKKPRFMWASLTDDDWGWGTGRVCPADTLDYHSKDIVWRVRETRKNIWTGQDLGYAIQVWFDDNWCFNSKDINHAVLATTQGQDPPEWNGPIVVTCQSLAAGSIEYASFSLSRNSDEMLDMDLLAYSHLAGFLIDYSNDKPSHSFCKGPKVQCVEIVYGQGKFGDNSAEVHRLVHLPRSHPMFHGQSTLSEVSKLIQEPLITWEVPAKTSVRRYNPQIVRLHICWDPTMPRFGWAPERYNLDVGTHLVARADGQPLTGETVDAMVDFCRFHLSPYFQFCIEMEQVHLEHPDKMSLSCSELRQKVMDQITPENWKTYLAQWKAEQIDRSAATARGDRVYTIEKARAGLERMAVSEIDSDRVSDILFNMRDFGLDMYKQKYGEN